jgi:hypothetical protein
MNSSKNANLVLFTLATSDKPLTISDMQFRSGMSYNTVKRTVFADSRVVRHEGYPARFTMEMPPEFDTRRMVIQYDRPEEGWITWLNEIRPLLVSITAISKDMSLDEVERKSTMFASLGTSFSTLSKDLIDAVNHDDTMDWFEYFRGEVDGSVD